MGFRCVAGELRLQYMFYQLFTFYFYIHYICLATYFVYQDWEPVEVARNTEEALDNCILLQYLSRVVTQTSQT